MAGIKDFAKQEVMLGLRGGGQMAPALLNQRADSIMKRFYLESACFRLPVYIDQVLGQRFYAVPDPQITVESERMLVCLSTVAYLDPADPLAPLPEEINSRTVLSRSSYGFDAMLSDTSQAWKLNLYTTPGASVKRGLELVQAYCSTSDEFVHPSVASRARDGVTALLKYTFLMDYGKPWSDPKQANVEYASYLESVGRTRILADLDFTQRDIMARSDQGFIL